MSAIASRATAEVETSLLGWHNFGCPPEGAISTTAFQPGNILWPSGATPVLELYPPGLICRFNPQGGMFKACPLHLVSENLTWQTPGRYLPPAEIRRRRLLREFAPES